MANTSNKTKKAQVKASAPEEYVAKEVDPSQYINVRNGFQGRLIYISSRTGEHFVWDEFGDEQEIELRELKNAKNSCKRFFTDNWFMFDDDWVIDYLGVRQFYKNALTIDSFDDIFTKSAKEVEKVVSKLSDGQKASLSYRARVLISERKIDSLSVIDALEKALKVELIER